MAHPKFEHQRELGNIRFCFNGEDLSYLCLYLPGKDAKWANTYAYCVKDGTISGGNGMDELGCKLIVRLLWDCFDNKLRQIPFNELIPTAMDLFLKTMEEVL